VNRILQFLGRGLVRLLRTLGVSLEVDMHLTHGVDVARLRIVGELVAINLVITVVLAPVHDNMNIPQIGVAAGLKLHRLGSSNGVESAATFRLGKGEPLAGLLNVDAQLCGHIVQRGTNAGAGDPVRHSDRRHQHHHTHDQPLAYLSYGLEHL
jgi:hypothetical protein